MIGPNNDIIIKHNAYILLYRILIGPNNETVLFVQPIKFQFPNEFYSKNSLLGISSCICLFFFTVVAMECHCICKYCIVIRY